MATTLTRTAVDADRTVRRAAAFFTVAVLLHNADHLRRGGDSVSLEVFVAGSLAIVVEVAVVALVFGRHRLAPDAAVAAGFGLAFGYLVVHGLPARSWLSDSLVERGASGLSQGAALLEVVAALGLGAAGVHALRRGAASHGSSVALRHPAVLAMAGGNALILVLSIVDRWG